MNTLPQILGNIGIITGAVGGIVSAIAYFSKGPEERGSLNQKVSELYAWKPTIDARVSVLEKTVARSEGRWEAEHGHD